MLSEPEDQLETKRLLELDRSGWNVPTPPIAPVGRLSEVWPVHPTVASPLAEDRLVEDRA